MFITLIILKKKKKYTHSLDIFTGFVEKLSPKFPCSTCTTYFVDFRTDEKYGQRVILRERSNAANTITDASGSLFEFQIIALVEFVIFQLTVRRRWRLEIRYSLVFVNEVYKLLEVIITSGSLESVSSKVPTNVYAKRSAKSFVAKVLRKTASFGRKHKTRYLLHFDCWKQKTKKKKIKFIIFYYYLRCCVKTIYLRDET